MIIIKNHIKYLTLIFLIIITSGFSDLKQNPYLIYNKKNKMGQADFWLNNLKNPDKLILSLKEIKKLNKKAHKNKFIRNPLFENENKKGEIIKYHLIQSLQWIKRFKKYDKNNNHLKDPAFSKKLQSLLNLKKIPEIIKCRFCLVITNTYLRSFPTNIMVMKKPDDVPFDIFQKAFLDTGEEVTLFHTSMNGKWGYVQAYQGRGWVCLKDMAWTYQKKDVQNYVSANPFIIALDWEVIIYSDSNFLNISSSIHMGQKLPLLDNTEKCFVVKSPSKKKDGTLSFKKGYIKKDNDVSIQYLKLTPRNIALQSFKMLGNDYSWGGKEFNTDCSSYLRRIFLTTGLKLPRFSFYQIKHLKKKRVNKKNKKYILDTLKPFETLLYYPNPNHVMLYIGKFNDNYYIIHNKWSYKIEKDENEKEIFIKKIIVSDINLGQDSKEGSIFKRISYISTF